MKRVFDLGWGIFIFTSFSIGLQASSQEPDFNHVASSYTTAFNEHNLDKLTSFWAQDATYTNFSDQVYLQGIEEIANYFKEELKETPDLKLSITIDNTKVDEPGKITQKGTAVTTSKNEPESKSAFLAEWARINDSWKLKKVVEIDLQLPSSHYEKLKDLDWLVGQWMGNFDYAKLSLNATWNENKNFIIQNFTSTVLDQKNLEGKQIIGWDPIKKKIRSWIIDSDGGFGEGSWNKQADQWFVAITYTLPDGRLGSSTHIYRKIDDNAFTLASQNRDVDGKILPDIKPFTIEKAK